ncbi:hypothetical protein [Pseudomonas aeruginosa]|mgnify:CR=1 FL=1|uniref:hypothetical protein n=1 Tax=Pseudomonas aeruginosa TaxID=287 RepID=UPI0002EAB901|nr:hypothetical protein [Pseudomonas aeruginosa]AGO40985.1 hypothetical protein M062_18205 [Pseudomonas aeruginosa RP73]ALY49087.1 hypothetical protein HW08_17275 [Pseudomonas aeruginosa]EIU3403265.1 hypothetical protein [Pseudomonas aeruginosa]EIZ0538887.1 hypothetical protein [Pseudomonas aeruginosa]EKV4126173.1 hypothetical protein [Pseudomonas aeruginosa]
MQDLGFALLLIGYVWSVASGGSRSIPCALLCLLLFPLAQLAFAINDAPMRPPLALAALGAGLAYLGGGSVFG